MLKLAERSKRIEKKNSFFLNNCLRMKDRDRTLFIIIMPQFSSGCPILKRKQNYDFLWQME